VDIEDSRPTLELPEFLSKQADIASASVYNYYVENKLDLNSLFEVAENGDTCYSEHGQDLFNGFYDDAEEFLLGLYKKGS
jgi:hypothetical protein